MITRKKFLKASAGTAIAYSALNQLGAQDHSKHVKPLPQNTEKAIQSAADCIAAGEICKAHCIELLGMGDKKMYECIKSVSETITLCESFMVLASQKSPLTGKIKSLCIKACQICKDECMKHATHHKQCKDCADACADCIKIMKKA